MKNLIIILLAMVLSNLATAQNMRDVIQLKNGSVIKGTITEQSPPSQLKIQTSDGSIFVYKYDEIDKITKEEIIVPNKADQFVVANSVWKSTFKGLQIRRMSWKKLKTTLHNANDPEINKDLSRLQTKRVLNTTFSTIGSVLMALGAVGIASAPDDPSALGVVGGGLVFFIVGAVTSSGSKALTKKMMLRYNAVLTPAISFNFEGAPSHKTNQFAYGFTLRKRF